MKKTGIYLTLLFLFSGFGLMAQKASDRVRMKQDQVRKLSYVILEKDGKKFPKSYLYRMTRDTLTLISPVLEVSGEPTIYCYKKMALDDFDFLTVSNRNERLKFSILTGLGVGALSYILTKRVTQSDVDEQPNLTLLGQRANSGNIEAVTMGITGFGLGLLIGELVSERKIDLRRNQREAVRRLKRFNNF